MTSVSDYITYRTARPSDLNVILKMKNMYLQDNYDATENWGKLLVDCNEFCYVAHYKGILVGYCICIPNTDHRKIVTIESLAVDESFRSNGIGKVLLIKCLLAIRRHDSEIQVMVHCRKGNEIAISLYEKLKFTNTNTIEHYYKNPTEHAYVMIK